MLYFSRGLYEKNSFTFSGVSSINMYEKIVKAETKRIALKVKYDGSTSCLFPEEFDLPSLDSDGLIAVFKSKPKGFYSKPVMRPSDFDDSIAVEDNKTVYYDLGQIVCINKDGNYKTLLKADDKNTVFTGSLPAKKNFYFDFVPAFRGLCVSDYVESDNGFVVKVDSFNSGSKNKTESHKLFYYKYDDGSATDLLTGIEGYDLMYVNSFTVKSDIAYCSVITAKGPENCYINLSDGKTYFES